jgi:hypothetical protein
MACNIYNYNYHFLEEITCFAFRLVISLLFENSSDAESKTITNRKNVLIAISTFLLQGLQFIAVCAGVTSSIYLTIFRTRILKSVKFGSDFLVMRNSSPNLCVANYAARGISILLACENFFRLDRTIKIVCLKYCAWPSESLNRIAKKM